jgi:hypothetical protein
MQKNKCTLIDSKDKLKIWKINYVSLFFYY